ncbi:MAG: hypothetical protein SFU98_10030 [Leptospiraceae bacterium]|nr:hypothetical protein [Leptospiraceae bacterium]
MKTIQSQIPDFLFAQIENVARKENISIDQIVSMAISALLPIITMQENIDSRAKRGNWTHFQSILEKVPSIEPDSFDKLN